MPYLPTLNAKRRAIEADPAVTFYESGDFVTVSAPAELTDDLRWIMSERGYLLNHAERDGDDVTLTFFRLK